MRKWLVVYEVRYGPAGSGASWMEEDMVVEATDEKEARRRFREREVRLPNGRGWYEVGRHSSTREVE